MFSIKNCLILLLSATLLTIEPSFAMFPDYGELPSSSSIPLNLTNPEDTYMVHLSKIMSENSTKIAGAIPVEYDFITLDSKRVIVPAEGSMIRLRITLHHCFGGIVPEGAHGLPVDTLFGKVTLPSDLYNSKDVCAYLDPLSEFKGELIGGVPEDMMSIDRHTYKNKSIVIIPHHRVEEFKLQNPHFLGQIIEIDSHKITVTEKVEEIISQTSNQISLKKLYTNINLEMKEKKFDTLNKVGSIFKNNGLMCCSHNETAFKAMENLIHPLNMQINAGYEKNNRRIFLAVDQISSRLAMIRSLLDIALDSSLKSLNDEKKSAMKNWQQDTLGWLNLFEIDENLRQAFGTTLFIDNPRLGIFIQNRGNKEKLHELAKWLPPMEDNEDLKLYSQELFPELTFSDIVSGAGWNDFIQQTDFQVLVKLKDHLVKEGYSQQGHGLILIRLLNKISKAIGKGFSIESNDIKHFQETLKGLRPSSHLQANIQPMIENLLLQDGSDKNKNTRKYLNSDLGKFFQEKIWGKSKHWTYRDLLLQSKYTHLLFEDLENLNFKDCKKDFIDIVRRWMLEQASKEPRTVSEDRPGKNFQDQRFKNPRFSIANIQGGARMQQILEEYCIYLSSSFIEEHHPFNILIEQGCFTSWPELLHSILPLEGLSSAEIKKILQNTRFYIPQNTRFYTPYDLDIQINKYKSEKKKNLSLYQEEVEKYKAEAERLYQFSRTNTTFGVELSEVFEKLIYGMEREIPCGLDKYKIIIPPNWARAWDLYNKALAQIGPIKWRINQLKRFMQPVFDKALTVRYVPKNESH